MPVSLRLPVTRLEDVQMKTLVGATAAALPIKADISVITDIRDMMREHFCLKRIEAARVFSKIMGYMPVKILMVGFLKFFQKIHLLVSNTQGPRAPIFLLD